jgi:hypothetical protein
MKEFAGFKQMNRLFMSVLMWVKAPSGVAISIRDGASYKYVGVELRNGHDLHTSGLHADYISN